MLGHDIAGESGAGLGRRCRTDRALDRCDVVVDGLRQTDDGERLADRVAVPRECSRVRGGVVAADRMEDGDPVAGQLPGGGLERIDAGRCEPAALAVLDVGEPDP